MRLEKGTIVLSPVDLTRFQTCEHASTLDLRFTLGDKLHPAEDTADGVLLQKNGLAHEKTFPAKLTHDDLVKISRDKDFATAAVIYDDIIDKCARSRGKQLSSSSKQTDA